jgi:2,4-dienoyl-CoA reductase-like NADH-dependent reductase (Old Yellow Enzyme family)
MKTPTTPSISGDPLFQPFTYKGLSLANRIVMAPMTRGFSPDGVLTDEVVAYYQRRAEADVGLIISEGTVVNRPSSSNAPNYPHFYGERALAGWHKVIESVHAVGGKMAPQLWHQGIVKPQEKWQPPVPFEGPSGLVTPTQEGGVAMDLAAIEATQEAFITAAVTAKELGFDTIELHGAHGYLIDQFFWSAMNRRSDRYGGASIAERSRFALEIVRGIREKVGPDYPIIFRLSQWKQQDYTARIATSPDELAEWVQPLADAGVDIFHCSQRRIEEPEFSGSPLNFAGWVKKLTGRPTISVGSVGLSSDFLTAFAGQGAEHRRFDWVYEALGRGDFDLVAIGRSLLADPDWATKIRDNRVAELRGFSKEHLATLY